MQKQTYKQRQIETKTSIDGDDASIHTAECDATDNTTISLGAATFFK